MLLERRDEGCTPAHKCANGLKRSRNLLVLSVSQFDRHRSRRSFRLKRLPGLPATTRYLSLRGFRLFKLAHSFVRAGSEFT